MGDDPVDRSEDRLLGGDAPEVGFTPARIIWAATRNAADHLGEDENIGTLEAGNLAGQEGQFRSPTAT